MTSTPISEKDVAELRALFDSVGEGESYLTRRLRNVGRGLLALATQDAEIGGSWIEVIRERSDGEFYVARYYAMPTDGEVKT